MSKPVKHTDLVDKEDGSLYLIRLWDFVKDQPVVQLGGLGQKGYVRLTQEQVKELLPSLQGFSASHFRGPEDV